ncbi:TadE/TadG family type IV pilus assembly protein [Lachnoclostridium sp. Marseille-P6806]|uniref:TadE/TadG family type IV pilus assembly protein n=1 Tax=Lachnoclostridium sp. Marseille-P6806 TaxID=2364793 RepID=UPI001031DD66|nr:TadE/TadG family type IV pilus assembly protein [Lachnoclostridium sp. Marseille-P6806]
MKRFHRGTKRGGHGRSGEKQGAEGMRENGQAMVEFALVLPFLLALLCAIIDFGWILSCKNELTNICGETARYAAIHAQDSNVRDQAEGYMNSHALNGTPTMTYFNNNGDYAVIKMEEQISYMTGFTGVITGSNTVTIKAQAAMPVEPYAN